MNSYRAGLGSGYRHGQPLHYAIMCNLRILLTFEEKPLTKYQNDNVLMIIPSQWVTGKWIWMQWFLRETEELWWPRAQSFSWDYWGVKVPTERWWAGLSQGSLMEGPHTHDSCMPRCPSKSWPYRAFKWLTLVLFQTCSQPSCPWGMEWMEAIFNMC